MEIITTTNYPDLFIYLYKHKAATYSNHQLLSKTDPMTIRLALSNSEIKLDTLVRNLKGARNDPSEYRFVYTDSEVQAWRI